MRSFATTGPTAGPSGWNALLEAPPPARVLAEDLTADWLVIGAGFAVLAAARRLHQLQPGERIVMLDAMRLATGPVAATPGS